MPVQIKNQQWDVDGDGCACVIVPGIPSATVSQVSSSQMDAAIDKQTARKERLTARVARAQAELDGVTTIVDGLTALRATVTSEPA